MAELSVLQRLETVRACRLLRSLAPEDLMTVAKVAESHVFPAGAVLCEEGAAANGLWVLASGTVRLSHVHPAGDIQLIGHRTPVAPLELSAVLESGACLTTVSAEVPVTALWLSRPALLAIFSTYPEARTHAIEELCRDLRERDIAANAGQFNTARERIACSLLRLARQFGEDEDGAMRIAHRVTRQDLASTTGVSLETSIRTLSAMEQDGIINTEAQVITLIDQRALREVAGCSLCLADCRVFEPGYPGERAAL